MFHFCCYRAGMRKEEVITLPAGISLSDAVILAQEIGGDQEGWKLGSIFHSPYGEGEPLPLRDL